MAEDHDELLFKLRFREKDAAYTHSHPTLTFADMGRLLGLNAYRVYKRVD